MTFPVYLIIESEDPDKQNLQLAKKGHMELSKSGILWDNKIPKTFNHINFHSFNQKINNPIQRDAYIIYLFPFNTEFLRLIPKWQVWIKWTMKKCNHMHAKSCTYIVINLIQSK